MQPTSIFNNHLPLYRYLVWPLVRGWVWVHQQEQLCRAKAELRAMDTRELLDIGVDIGGIDYAVQHGRSEDCGHLRKRRTLILTFRER